LSGSKSSSSPGGQGDSFQPNARSWDDVVIEPNQVEDGLNFCNTAFDHSPVTRLSRGASLLPPPTPVNSSQPAQPLLSPRCLLFPYSGLLLLVSFGTARTAGVRCSQLEVALQCGAALFLARSVSIFAGAVDADHLTPGNHSWVPGVPVPVCRPLPKTTTTIKKLPRPSDALVPANSSFRSNRRSGRCLGRANFAAVQRVDSHCLAVQTVGQWRALLFCALYRQGLLLTGTDSTATEPKRVGYKDATCSLLAGTQSLLQICNFSPSLCVGCMRSSTHPP